MTSVGSWEKGRKGREEGEGREGREGESSRGQREVISNGYVKASRA